MTDHRARNHEIELPVARASPRDTSVGEIALDVRPLVAEKIEPLGTIMTAVERVPVGGVLVLDAPFDPAPLRRLLAKKGFDYELTWLAGDHCRVRFRRVGTATEFARDEAKSAAVGAKVWRETDGEHIDVRGLAPPEPMVCILRLVERADCNSVVIAHLDREPMFLFPELGARRWRYERVGNDPDEIRYRLTREGA